MRRIAEGKVGRNTVTGGGPITVTVTEPIPCHRSREGLLSVCLASGNQRRSVCLVSGNQVPEGNTPRRVELHEPVPGGGAGHRLREVLEVVVGQHLRNRPTRRVSVGARRPKGELLVGMSRGPPPPRNFSRLERRTLTFEGFCSA